MLVSRASDLRVSHTMLHPRIGKMTRLDECGRSGGGRFDGVPPFGLIIKSGSTVDSYDPVRANATKGFPAQNSESWCLAADTNAGRITAASFRTASR